ncbi:hypothetical protein EGR_06258 [Echinococcus granulosus]|uniref:Uncharacterized protein n=1 Tax=Echinococcus granulosus TaxID=6210 RepID=W6UZ18_ECHGR|nr:hypothetical protein EGR_06258 [Echinococcus granulosus]EUB58834.1 hypothetical protein EGR_06258 [Echinococcus granulosus]
MANRALVRCKVGVVVACAELERKVTSTQINSSFSNAHSFACANAPLRMLLLMKWKEQLLSSSVLQQFGGKTQRSSQFSGSNL